MKNKAEEIDSDYKLIPMADIDDEARKIAVRWVEDLQDAGGIAIRQKHKLAYDIMNYARRKQQDGWISVKDYGQPKQDWFYIVCLTVNGNPFVHEASWNGTDKWRGANGADVTHEVTHWRNLPKPPTQ